MSFKFEKLHIWQKAMDFGEEIYTVSQRFPKHEIYNLSSQLLRASDSIALNISEGSIEVICRIQTFFRVFNTINC